jgi:dipeptidyl aminopeptidase/acylaminoacyl peptidase
MLTRITIISNLRYCLLFSYTMVVQYAQGQKPPLDIHSTSQWSGVGSGLLTDDGKYACYSYNAGAENPKVVVVSTAGPWKMEFSNASTPSFIQDKSIAFKLGRDSLCLFNIANKKISYIDSVLNFSTGQLNGKGVLACKMLGEKREFIMRDIHTGKELSFSSVTEYQFNKQGDRLIIKSDSGKTQCVRFVSSLDKRPACIWTSEEFKITSSVFDKSGKKLGFTTGKSVEGTTVTELWYYEEGMLQAKKIIADQELKNYSITNSGLAFTDDGRKLVFQVTAMQQVSGKPQPNAAQVDVWSYLDQQLQSQQLIELNRYPSYGYGVSDLETGQTHMLTKENESIMERSNDYALLVRQFGLRGRYEAYWNRAAELDYTLVSLKDGTRTPFLMGVQDQNTSISLSPDGKWLLYWNGKDSCYYSYEIATGNRKNLTAGIYTNWRDEENDISEPRFAGRAWWMIDSRNLLIKDNYDIWQLDISGKVPPFNLTNEYGRKNSINFDLLEKGSYVSTILPEKDGSVILTAIDNHTKDRGFYKLYPGRQANPEKLFMGPYVFGGWGGHDSYIYPPIKAKNASMYLFYKSSATEAPNYYTTTDFRKFSQVSNAQPQKQFNWYTTELHEWTSLDGQKLQGILYKPENFDATKKYPVIFDYYEVRSDELNLFIYPHASEGRINIPLFVSKGYLVFVPDIKYRIGEVGESAYNAIVSAAKHVAGLSYVDTSKMGLQGHSFGGYQTNYVITHSNLFAAACSAAGISDETSKYGSGLRAGFVMYLSEKSQSRLGTTPWENPGLYIKNSPIYFVDKITTPLLMMANKNDGAVPFSQGLELFVAMRRLGKKVWMLQYENGTHEVGGVDAFDFHTRMMQFFDHYLKNAPAPVWMTRGIPANRKGIEDGLGLDNEITTPGPGLLHDERN